MEGLIQEIIQRLKIRENQVLDVNYQPIFDREAQNTRDFLYHKKVYIHRVSSIFVHNIYRGKIEDPWVQWLLTSFDYGCHVTLELAFSQLELLPQELLLNYPLTVCDKKGHQYLAINKHILTYQDVYHLPVNSFLVVTGHQQVTALAQEELQRLKIIQLERRGSYVNGESSW